MRYLISIVLLIASLALQADNSTNEVTTSTDQPMSNTPCVIRVENRTTFYSPIRLTIAIPTADGGIWSMIEHTVRSQKQREFDVSNGSYCPINAFVVIYSPACHAILKKGVYPIGSTIKAKDYEGNCE